MAEYVNNKEETINVGEPIIFENKTEASFDVSVGVVFRKSGLYRVSVYGNNVSIQKEPERMRGKWIDEGFYADGHGAHAFRCSECGGHIIEYDADPFCKWCGADMRGEQDEQE